MDRNGRMMMMMMVMVMVMMRNRRKRRRRRRMMIMAWWLSVHILVSTMFDHMISDDDNCKYNDGVGHCWWCWRLCWWESGQHFFRHQHYQIKIMTSRGDIDPSLKCREITNQLLINTYFYILSGRAASGICAIPTYVIPNLSPRLTPPTAAGSGLENGWQGARMMAVPKER